MALAVGDGPITFDGQQGTVVATTATLDANGRGSLAFGGSTFQFRCLKETATPTPLVATADTYLRIGLLRQTANPLLFVLVFDDLPAPGRGRWIQGPGGSWQESWAFAGLDSVTFVTDWKPGTITVKNGGVAAANVFCDVVYTHSTNDGTHECWHEPAYPYNGLAVVGGVPLRDSLVKLGSFKTDANGVLWACRPNGTLEPITFPRYFAAIGQRASDVWPSAPTPERVLTQARLFYLQESVEIAEGTAAALDTAAVTITITGPPGGVAVLYWEGSVQSAVNTLDGSGIAVQTGLPPGRYVGYCGHPTDNDKGVARASVTVTQSGGSGTLAFAGTWTTSVGGTNGIVYAYDDVPCGGAEVWSFKGSPGTWQLVGTAAADGTFGPVALGPDLSMIYHPTYGAAMIDYGIVAAIWWDPVLSVRCGAYTVSDLPTVTQGIVPWGVAGGHDNLPPMARAGYLKSQTTGTKYYFSPGTACGTISEPFPVWLPVANWQSLIDPSPSGPYLYDSYDADDISLGAIVSGSSDQTTPPWADPISCPWYHALYYGAYLVAVLGGKQNGVIAEYALSILTKGVLREPERYGLETGKRVSPLEVRSRSAMVEAQQTGASLALTFCSWEDEYCGGPAWTSPDAEGYVRGYCVQCADYGISTDCRTYFSTKTLGAYADWSTRVVKNTSAGGHVDRLVTGWPRPEEYSENDSYKVDDWEGLGIPRWVATHLLLGTLAGGSFVDGESIADAEARLARTVGPCQLKLLLTSQYLGTGKTVSVTATRADNGQSHVLTGTVPAGAQVGDIVLLSPCPHHEYPKPTSWFTDVTAAAEVSGDGYLACQIVNDGPAWRSSSGVIVTHQAYSPFACDVLLQEWEPECRTDYMGRAHVVYNRDGGLYHRIWQVGQQAWGEAVCLTQRANWVTACQHHAFEIVGPVLLVTCESGGQRVWFRSTDSYGETWTYRSGNVAFSGLTNVQTTVDYLGRVWGVGLDSNSLLTAECTPDLGVTGYYRNAVDPSAADSEQPGLCIAGSTFILVTSQGGSLRTWVSKRGGEHWEQAPVVE